MSDVYVLGVDMIKFGRFPDRTVPDLGAEAALLALDDAGLNIGNLEAFYCGNLGPAEATLKGLETDVYSIEHSSTRPIPKAPGMNVGQPYNRPYTGFGWFQ